METFFAPLLQKAFDRAPAREANAAIERTRQQLGDQVRSFEAVVAPDAGKEWLGTALLPRMVYHLESLGIRPPKFGGIFASLFVGEELHFVHMKDLMEFACAQLGLTADEMYQRWGTGEARHAVDQPAKKREGPPLALPSGKPE
ncbi:MAG TPA: STAUR_1299 family protein [Myxococcales bacterium]|jgi:GNAT superfamily N-acetyltransferase